ncbi:hypothetical protein Tco_0521282, partial [Tanacetum coccineum]
DAGQADKVKIPDQEYILLPLVHTSSYVSSSNEEDNSSPKDDAGKKNDVETPATTTEMNNLGEDIHANSTNRVNTVSSSFFTNDHSRPTEKRSDYESWLEQNNEINDDP